MNLCNNGESSSPVCVRVLAGYVRGYSLTAPHNYTVFTSDIEVDYSVPAGVTLRAAVVQLVFTDTGQCSAKALVV